MKSSLDITGLSPVAQRIKLLICYGLIGLHSLSAKLKNKRQRYHELQSDPWCPCHPNFLFPFNQRFLMARSLLISHSIFLKNADIGKSLLVKGLSKSTVKIINEQPRNRELQNDTRCADIVIFDWPINI